MIGISEAQHVAKALVHRRLAFFVSLPWRPWRLLWYIRIDKHSYGMWVFFMKFFFSVTEQKIFFSFLFQATELLQRLARLSFSFLAIPPLRFYTSVTWIWRPFSRLKFLLLSTRPFNWEICVFASFKLTCRPYWPGNTGSKKNMEHRTIFIGTVFIVRDFKDLLRTNICS